MEIKYERTLNYSLVLLAALFFRLSVRVLAVYPNISILAEDIQAIFCGQELSDGLPDVHHKLNGKVLVFPDASVYQRVKQALVNAKNLTGSRSDEEQLILLLVVHRLQYLSVYLVLK